MATLQSWRKAFGALKDTTTVGLAHVNSDYADLDVAIVKATNHVECPPKERHLRKLLVATSSIRPRADVAYCIHGIARRLAKTHNWTVALKTLIVIHRTLREGDPTFREELVNFSLRGRILQLSNFKDDSSPIAWDCSAWVRTYALFLEERLECFRVLKYDIESDCLPRPVAADSQGKGYSKTRDLGTEELLEHLLALQQLLHRLIGCQPEGAASGNYVIQYALAMVLKESFKIYCATNDGIINLIDKYFEMPRHEAIKAFEIYKRAGLQATGLSNFYDTCRGLKLTRNFQFPVLKEPPQSFLSTMEEYIREAPSMVSALRETLEFPERLQLTYKPDDGASSSYVEPESPTDEYKSAPMPMDIVPVSNVDIVPPQNHFDDVDLLGFDFNAPDAFSVEESNAFAIALVPSDTASSSNFGAFQANNFDSTGWELALVTTPSSNMSAFNEQQLAGGLDSLTLDSLYDQAGYIASQQTLYGTPAPNPFEEQDLFSFSNNVAPTTSAQMPAMPQQQQAVNPFGQYPPTYHQLTEPHQPLQPPPPQHTMTGAPNPFGESVSEAFPMNNNNHQQTNNPFGSPGML